MVYRKNMDFVVKRNTMMNLINYPGHGDYTICYIILQLQEHSLNVVGYSKQDKADSMGSLSLVSLFTRLETKLRDPHHMELSLIRG